MKKIILSIAISFCLVSFLSAQMTGSFQINVDFEEADYNFSRNIHTSEGVFVKKVILQ